MLAARVEPGGERTPLEVFERIYRQQDDPWRYASSAYERAKYRRTLAALGKRRYRRALEVGSSIGVFTASLAERCEQVVALEPSPTALARARERLRSRANVKLVDAAVPEGLPPGPFDLVLCSEVLYYLGESLLLETLRELERRLAAGGTLLAVHFRGSHPRGPLRSLLTRPLRRGRRGRPAPWVPLSGDAVHELLRAHTRLTLTHEEQRAEYLLERYDRQGDAFG